VIPVTYRSGVNEVDAPTPPTGGPVYARFEGPIVMVGFGSIGKGTLPLIERHIAFDRSKLVVIAPDDRDRSLLDERQIRFIHRAVTKENFRDTAINRLFSDHPINLCKLPVAVAASIDLVSLDGGPSQIMVDLTPGHIVSAVVDFPFVQRDSFDDVKEDDLGVPSLITQAFGFFELKAISAMSVYTGVADFLLSQYLFHRIHRREEFAGNGDLAIVIQ